MVTLLSASDDAAKQEVLQALAIKVAGYGKTTPKLTSGPALAAQLAQPDTPAAYLSTASYAHLDHQWATVAARADEHFTFVRDARDLGGVHPKSIYRDPDGSEWLFKPLAKASDAYIANADEMTYRVARLVDPRAIEVRKITVGGQVGTIQRMKTVVKAPKDYDGIDVSAIAPEELAQLQQHHVLDWLLSNHDAHSANFLRLQDGSVVAIDRAQAFKYFGRDKLDIGYNPNNLPEHPTTLYNAIFSQVKKKKLSLLTTTPVDLLLTDYEMPEMRGDQLIVAIRALRLPVKTILASGHPHAAHLAAECGADGYYRKGEPPLHLLSCVAKVLEDATHAKREA